MRKYIFRLLNFLTKLSKRRAFLLSSQDATRFNVHNNVMQNKNQQHKNKHKNNNKKTQQPKNPFKSQIYLKSNTLLEINNQSAIFINQPIKIKINRK